MFTLPTFTPDCAQIVYVQLDLNPERPLPDYNILSPLEKQRLSSIKQYGDRLRYIMGRLIVRNMLANILNTNIHNIQLTINDGKPRLLAQLSNNANLCFNISHSNELVMVAFSAHGEIGIDVEKVRDLNNMSAMAKRVMNKDEFTKYSALDNTKEPEAFFRLWTAKESILKYWGTGFRIAPNSFQIGILPHTNSRWLDPNNNNIIMLTGKDLIVNGDRYFWHVASHQVYNNLKLVQIN